MVRDLNVSSKENLPAGFFFSAFFFFSVPRHSAALRPGDVTILHRSDHRTRPSAFFVASLFHPQRSWRSGVQRRRPIPTLTIPTAFSMQRDVRENSSEHTADAHAHGHGTRGAKMNAGSVHSDAAATTCDACSRTDSATVTVALSVCVCVPPSGRRREKEIRRLTATSDWSNLPAHIKAQLEAQQSRKQSLWILSHMTPDINDHCTIHVHRALTDSGSYAWPTCSCAVRKQASDWMRAAAVLQAAVSLGECPD